MQELIDLIKNTTAKNQTLPFSVYTAFEEQHILNVPVIKPLLICVLSGNKVLGENDEVKCPKGSFVFLSNTANIAMRNIPIGDEYFALLIEFEYSDFYCLDLKKTENKNYFLGEINTSLEHTLKQFVEWSLFSPQTIWHLRRQEILQLLMHLGFNEVASIMQPPTVSHKVHMIITERIQDDISARDISSYLAMSESTLRRKLQSEHTSLQEIKDRVRLGYGLHRVQSSLDSISVIAEQCGYSSQSRFTDKFKQLFGITPTGLRKTRLRGSGE